MFRFRSLELLAFTASLMLTRSLAAQVMQIAPDDFIISEMGEPEDEIAAAHNPQVAWNPVDQEYLVVWEGQESVTPTTEHGVEIYAVRINRFGQRVGDQIRVSDMGPAGDTEHEASDPAVAYNPDDHEYLVLWSGDDVNSGEFEIHGQRLSAAAEPLGENFRITTTDVDENTSSDAEIPRVAYNSRDQEYMVICTVDDNSASANNHYE
ncbi:MAG TPA: hypothetical protein PLS90_17025, partial [Candidatus Sumerlaeota bacterium]|nr:hypothetical protein [Candidatus Sumerlaeota bacterium]